MNFTFLNGTFLFAALAALLPLLIHLISRRRVSTVDFSSLRFLKELERKRIRRVRLRQILLLIVRSLIILAAALALARPTLKGVLGGGGGAHAKTSIAIIMDDSASMSRTGEDGDLFPDAVRSAREIAELLDDGDQAFLVTAGDPASAVLAEGTFSPEVLLEAVNGTEAGAAATDYSRALDLAFGLLAESRNLNRELYVLGDLQRTGWARAPETPGSAPAEDQTSGSEALKNDEGPRVYVLSIAGPTTNLGMPSVAIERKYGGAAGLFSVSARVSNHGSRNGEILVRLFIDGEQAGQAGVEVEGGGSATARFAVTVDESEWHEGWVELPPDALDADNRRYFVIPATRLTEVLVVRPDDARELDDADYLERALDPTAESDRFSVSVVSQGALASQENDRFPLVVLADVGRLEDAAVSWLGRHVDDGGGLLIVLGNRTDVRFWNAGLLPELAGVEILAPTERPDGVRLAPALQGHPLLEGLVVGERLVDDIAVRRAFDVRATEVEEVLELPGIGPALTLRRATTGASLVNGVVPKGEVAVLMTGVDPSWSDLPRSGFVVPLMHRLSERLSRTSSRPVSVTVGEDLVVRLGEVPTGRVEVDAPDGRTLTAELRHHPGPAAAVERAGDPGIYRFYSGGRTIALGAVNMDPRESDLSPVDRSEMEELMSPLPLTFVEAGARLEDEVLQARHGRELWRAFLYVALVLMAVEMYLARPRSG
ncbi:MAG: VWA domain-containing protein [Candidatus Eisenbacteria bacterium]